MHRRGQSAAPNFRNHFGGRSVMVADRAWDSRVVDRDDMTNDEPNSNEQNTHDGIYDFDGHRKQSLSDLMSKPAIRKAIRT